VPRRVSRLHAYAFAITAVVAASAARAMMPASLSGAPFFTFFIAVVAASWYGGLGPGVVATALSTAAAYALVPVVQRGMGGLSPAGLLTRFVLVCLVIAWFNDRLRRAQVARLVSLEQLAAQNESIRRGELAQRELAAIVESSDDAIVGIDVRGVITSWNVGAERLYGYAPSEAIGQPMTLVITPERLGEEEEMLARIRAGQRVEHFETQRVRKDGARLDVSLTLSPVRDGAGNLIGASKVARDISERRRAERLREELLERERLALADALAARDRLVFLAEVSALLTSSLDYDDTVDRVVRLALPRLGDYCTVLVEDEQGHFRHVVCGHVVGAKEPAVRELVRRVIEGPAPSNVPTFSEIVRKTGKPVIVGHEEIARAIARLTDDVDPKLLELGDELRPFAYVGVPLLVRGRTIGVISFGTGEQESRREYDQADVALVEEFARRVSPAIENARLFRQADELNRLKDEFLATLSHELRTPVSAIRGWAHLLAGGQLDEDATRRAVQAIERNAQAQSQLVDDILDVARGMAGNLRLEVARVDLATLAQKSVDAIAPAATAKQIAVQVNAREPVAVEAIRTGCNRWCGTSCRTQSSSPLRAVGSTSTSRRRTATPNCA